MNTRLISRPRSISETVRSSSSAYARQVVVAVANTTTGTYGYPTTQLHVPAPPHRNRSIFRAKGKRPRTTNETVRETRCYANLVATGFNGVPFILFAVHARVLQPMKCDRARVTYVRCVVNVTMTTLCFGRDVYFIFLHTHRKLSPNTRRQMYQHGLHTQQGLGCDSDPRFAPFRVPTHRPTVIICARVHNACCVIAI